jgi:hypothetical protein
VILGPLIPLFARLVLDDGTMNDTNIDSPTLKLLSRYDLRVKELQAPGEVWSKPIVADRPVK